MGAGNRMRARSAGSSRATLPSTSMPDASSMAADSIRSSAALSTISVTGSRTSTVTVSSPLNVAFSRSGSSRRSYREGTTVVGSR